MLVLRLKVPCVEDAIIRSWCVSYMKYLAVKPTREVEIFILLQVLSRSASQPLSCNTILKQ